MPSLSHWNKCILILYLFKCHNQIIFRNYSLKKLQLLRHSLSWEGCKDEFGHGIWYQDGQVFWESSILQSQYSALFFFGGTFKAKFFKSFTNTKGESARQPLKWRVDEFCVDSVLLISSVSKGFHSRQEYSSLIPGLFLLSAHPLKVSEHYARGSIIKNLKPQPTILLAFCTASVTWTDHLDHIIDLFQKLG